MVGHIWRTAGCILMGFLTGHLINHHNDINMTMFSTIRRSDSEVRPTCNPGSSNCISTEERSIAGSQTDQLRASQHSQVGGEFVLQGGSGLRNFCPNNLLTVFFDEKPGSCIVKMNLNLTVNRERA